MPIFREDDSFANPETRADLVATTIHVFSGNLSPASFFELVACANLDLIKGFDNPYIGRAYVNRKREFIEEYKLGFPGALDVTTVLPIITGITTNEQKLASFYLTLSAVISSQLIIHFRKNGIEDIAIEMKVAKNFSSLPKATNLDMYEAFGVFPNQRGLLVKTLNMVRALYEENQLARLCILMKEKDEFAFNGDNAS